MNTAIATDERTPRLRVSVVIVTDGRIQALRSALDALERVDYPAFEVVGGAGPARDGTRPMIEALAAEGRIKAATCEERNISKARNIGIAAAAGEVVAFLDDDALAESGWLADLAEAYADPAVGGAGGVVFDHTGADFQFRFSACDRTGAARHGLSGPAGGDFPFSAEFPHFLGANASFRREALAAIGGFDEEYDYYLDETDVCCRLVDGDWRLRQIDGAAVHHKYLSSAIRSDRRILLSRGSVIKNQLYFTLVNGRDHIDMVKAVRTSLAFVDRHRGELARHAEAGDIYPSAAEDFDTDADAALATAFARGLSGERKTLSPDTFANPQPFRSFGPRKVARSGSHAVVLIPWRETETEMPLESIKGRLGSDAAVRVFALGAPEHRIDYSDGIWLHHIRPTPTQGRRRPHAARHLSERLWCVAYSALAEYRRLERYVRFGRILNAAEPVFDVALTADGLPVESWD
ncbi:MAG: glycosyltransferase family 2 protein [Maricaulaceae bacterium]